MPLLVSVNKKTKCPLFNTVKHKFAFVKIKGGYLMFTDISKLIEEQKPKVRAFTNQKVLLTEGFRNKYLESMKDSSSQIEFYDTFAVVTSTKKLHIYIPNQWFYLAFIGAPLTKKVIDYREFIKSKSNLSNTDFKTFILAAKDGNLDENVFSKIVKELSNEETTYIKKFLTDYSWWGGAKDLSRSDYFVSPVLDLLDLINVSSSYVADISFLIANNFDIKEASFNSLFSLIEEESTSKDYEKLFRQWIIDRNEAVESNLRYVNTLNRFINAVNSELSEESFVPINIWENPKKFATQYSVESIMDLAERLKPNTAFVPKNGGSGSELKTIYNKYLEWARTLFETEPQEYHQQLRGEHRQYIYFGAPGTGKSYQLNQDSKLFGKNIERVTFHPNMSYGNFVGVFKPFPVKIELRDLNGKIVKDEDNNTIYEEKITYSYIPGPLIKQLVKAFMHPDEPYLLIIEELNRANVAAVFGDLFQLLDRKDDYSSEYPIAISEDLQQYFNTIYKEIGNEVGVAKMKETLKNGLVLPSNFYIWTTMNSADQGVMPMDTAFKRRWEQKYFGLDDAWLKNDGKKRFASYKKIEYPSNIGDVVERKFVSWNVLRRIINDILSTNKNIPEDKLLGPYFISEKVLTDTNSSVTETFKSKVLMYLFDDVAKQNRTLIFKNVEKVRYSEIVRTFELEGLKIFGITDDDIEKYEYISNNSEEI